jgi:serine/threonine protein phosphatase 1
LPTPPSKQTERRWPSFLRRKQQSPAAKPLPAIPPGERVYAIGDVHGCAAELDRLIVLIAADHEKRGPASQTIVLLGDLMNRGPDSAGVIRQARELVGSGLGRLIKGNHEELFVLASRGDHRAARTLMDNGGAATLASFGLTQQEIHGGNYHDLANLMKERIARDVVGFLERGEEKIRIGDYLFVHAGVRPGIPIGEQRAADLRWIRHEFLNSQAAHGAMIVHGHSISDEPSEQHNRIGIDTGAYRTGVLTAIGLEGTQRWFLSTAD